MPFPNRRFSLKPAFLLFILYSCWSATSAPNWKLIWSDEFSAATIDTSKWSFDTGTGTPLVGWGNNELQYYTRRQENVRIENGCLLIETRNERYETCSFTSGRINSKYKGDWTYGRYEIRAKLPKGKGMWPAIWMLPTDNIYGGWAASGEIDIMELVGHKPATVYGTLHYGGEWPKNVFANDSFTLASNDFSSDFHTFSVEWMPDTIRWFVDTVCYQTQIHGQPFDKRFYMILNLAVGGRWPGNPDATTIFPQIMYVDYVRVYADNAGMGIKNMGHPRWAAGAFNAENQLYLCLSSGLPNMPSDVYSLFDLMGRRASLMVGDCDKHPGKSVMSRNRGAYLYIERKGDRK